MSLVLGASSSGVGAAGATAVVVADASRGAAVSPLDARATPTERGGTVPYPRERAAVPAGQPASA